MSDQRVGKRLIIRHSALISLTVGFAILSGLVNVRATEKRTADTSAVLMIPGVLAGTATVPMAFALVMGNAFANSAWVGAGSFNPAFFPAFLISAGDWATSRASNRRRFSDSKSS